MNKKILFSGMIFLAGLMLISNVFALGVTPARTTLDFQSGLEKTISFSVLNSEQRDINLVVTAQGELKDYIEIRESSFSMSETEGSREISYTLSLPDKIKPGLHTGEVVILQLPEVSGTSKAYIGAALAVTSQIHIYVSYPGKYAEADLNIVNAEKGGEVVFIIPIISRGEIDLVSVKANIEIYSKLDEKVANFNTVEISVLSGERQEIVHKWKADVGVGTYRAVVTLIYDGETINLEKQFNVGTSDLELQQIEVNDFNLGGIAKLEMLVENKWSEQISGAYTQTEVYNKKGEVMADFKSPNYDILALSKKAMISYWDTAGVKQGTYETKVFLKYGESSTQKNLKLKVAENKIEVIGLGYVISSDGGGGSNSLMIILIIGIGVLILINLLWFFILRKKLKK